MICIYSRNNTDYEKNGDAVLIPVSCKLTLTINGGWQLTLEHPYDKEERYKLLVEGAIIRADIKCIAALETIQQRFRIYNYKKDLHSVTVIAFPIAMESTMDAPIDNLVIQNKTGAQAMTALQAYTEKYTLYSDITATGSTSLANTNINSAIAGGDDNCFIKVWGGEILYDNLKYKVLNRIGDTTAADHKVTYGDNLTNIEYTKDDSGVITRVYPISQDGIRLNGSGYIDSSHILDYAVPHAKFLTAPYNLVDTDAASPTNTAALTRAAVAGVKEETEDETGTGYANAIAAGIQPEYMKSIREDITEAVTTAALTGVASATLYNAMTGAIKEGITWLDGVEQPAWDWMGSYETGWMYGNEDGHAVSQYVRIGKKWSYFGANGYWQEPKDDTDEWDWYQVPGSDGKKYGNFTKYYAHNTYVYITMDGTLKKYWLDEQGWYDSDKSGDSDWSWQGSGTAADPWWFGDPDAEGDENKYAHSTWLFIDGIYYFFDEFGYYDGSTKFNDYQWDWIESGENTWFGNPDETFAATWVTNQWLKINGTWYYFDVDGYVESTNASITRTVGYFTTATAGLTTEVNSWRDQLYALLYSNMTAWVGKKYSQDKIDLPVVTITVNMADLSKTTEYAGLENLQTVKLGDSVICKDAEHDIETTNRVIGLTYDVLREYNESITIGKAASTVASMISGGSGSTEGVAGGFDTSAIEAQITALQNNKIGDVKMNGSSIVSDGAASFGIKPGEHISIQRSGNELTITGEGGGGLQYWQEDTNKIYRKTASSITGWDCDAAYKHGQFQATNGVSNWWRKKNTEIACCAYYSFNNLTYPMCISTIQEDAVAHLVFVHDMSASFTLNGVTLYWSEFSQNHVWGDVTMSGDVPPYLGDFTDKYEELNEDARATQAFVRDYLITISHFHTGKVTYSGIGGNNSEYVAWGGDKYGVGDFDASPQDMPYNVKRTGEVNAKDFKIDGVSIDQVRDVKVNGASVVTNKTANIDLTGYATKPEVNAKQDALTAGDHITILNDVISAEANANYYGTTDPARDLGTDGDKYYKYTGTVITTFDYIRMVIYKNRSNNTYTQLSDVVIKNDNGNYSWSGTSVSGSSSDTGEGPGNLIDGNTASKYCAIITPTTSTPLTITFTLGTTLDIETYNKWSWYTANDQDGRDPVTFSLFGSDNGSDWYELDHAENADITTSRRTLAYTGTLEAGVNLTILKEYIKIDGTWVENALPFEVNSAGELCMVVYEE